MSHCIDPCHKHITNDLDSMSKKIFMKTMKMTKHMDENLG